VSQPAYTNRLHKTSRRVPRIPACLATQSLRPGHRPLHPAPLACQRTPG